MKEEQIEPAELRMLKVSGIPPPNRPSAEDATSLKEVIRLIYKRTPIIRRMPYAHSSDSPRQS